MCHGVIATDIWFYPAKTTVRHSGVQGFAAHIQLRWEVHSKLLKTHYVLNRKTRNSPPAWVIHTFPLMCYGVIEPTYGFTWQKQQFGIRVFKDYRGAKGVLRGAKGVLKGCKRGAKGVLRWCRRESLDPCLSPIAYCILPIACCMLPIAYCLLHMAYCLLPID